MEEMKRFDLDEKKYGRLLSKTLPHVIHNDEELEDFTEELLRLMSQRIRREKRRSLPPS
jgi:hypothetical protein